MRRGSAGAELVGGSTGLSKVGLFLLSPISWTLLKLVEPNCRCCNIFSTQLARTRQRRRWIIKHAALNYDIEVMNCYNSCIKVKD